MCACAVRALTQDFIRGGRAAPHARAHRSFAEGVQLRSARAHTSFIRGGRAAPHACAVRSFAEGVQLRMCARTVAQLYVVCVQM